MILPNSNQKPFFYVTDNTGAPVAADATPTATLLKNGASSGVTVTVTAEATGEYSAAFTAGDWDTGDQLELHVDCAVGGVSLSGVVWREFVGDPADFKATGFAVPGSEMTLTSGERDSVAATVEAALFNDGDATALLQAIADKIAGDLTVGDISTQAIVSAIKADATLAAMIARIDATISSRSTFDASAENVTVDELTAAALALFASTDTGEESAVAGSVAKLAQGAGGGGGGDATAALQAQILAAISALGTVSNGVNERTTGASPLYLYVGEHSSPIPVQLVDVNGEPANLTGIATPVTFAIADYKLNELHSETVTLTENPASFNCSPAEEVTAAVTAPGKAHYWSIRDANGIVKGTQRVVVLPTA